MSDSADPFIRHSLRLYGMLLHLYPPAFRRQFGHAMLDTFEQLLIAERSSSVRSGIHGVWRTIAGELFPTIIRAYADALARPPALSLRIPLAALFPLAVFSVFLRFTTSSTDEFALFLWFALMAAGMIAARGRGWRCSAYAMCASVIAVSLPALSDAIISGTAPGILRVLPLLVAAAATVAMILSIYVRLVFEGIQRQRPSLA